MMCELHRTRCDAPYTPSRQGVLKGPAQTATEVSA
jgi:hypothetical protein